MMKINNIEESESFKISINDNSVTIDKKSLVLGEDEEEYFLRVPNTNARDHIRLENSESREINDGKTVTARIEPNRMYSVYDRNGVFQSERRGDDLYRFFDAKHKDINRNTRIAEYGNRTDRIDLFSKEKDMLISV